MILNRNNETNILIVGLGLMGGSYAKALKKCGYTVNAITRSQSSIDYALEHGIIDAGATTPTIELVSTAHMVVFAIYPKVFIEWIREYQHMFAPGTIITDVTGVKGSVVYDIQRELRDDVEFIAAHPMAGREVYGVASGCEQEVYFTHQRAICNPGRRLSLSGNGPTVGHFYAFLPGISEILAARGLIPAVLAGGGPLWARVGLIAPDDVAGLHWLPKILFDAALPGQRPAPGQQGD